MPRLLPDAGTDPYQGAWSNAVHRNGLMRAQRICCIMEPGSALFSERLCIGTTKKNAENVGALTRWPARAQRAQPEQPELQPLPQTPLSW